MVTLHFGSASANDGFTPHSTAAFNDLRPSRIVRELLQNSLDAAVEAGEATAQVRFQVEPIRRRDLPDAKGYATAFRKAVDSHGQLTDPAQEVVDRIKSGLESLDAGTAVLLSIVDNGIGLDGNRMNRLLSDGASGKSISASGSYGVGHLAPMALSNLRYVLYGGLTKDGSRIASGKVILAAHPGKKALNDGKGYLIRGFKAGLDGNLYDFLPLQSHPKLIAKHLDVIGEDWGHGCAVLIPAFNQFGSPETSLWEIVSKVAAYNFAPAIHRKKLVITVRQSGEEQRLDGSSLTSILKQEQEHRRAARSDSLFAGLRPSGQNAYQILQALTNKKPHSVSVKRGKARISLLTPSPNNSSRIDLFRNGMRITDDIPGLGIADFAGRQPFHAVIEIDAKDGRELHRLIRKAEGPMHDNLSFTLLSAKERDELKQKLATIAAWINEQVPAITDEVYTVNDFLVVNAGDDGARGLNSYAFWGVPTVVSRRASAQIVPGSEGGGNEETTGDGTGKPRPPRPPRPPQHRRSRPLPFRSAVAPTAPGKLVGQVISSVDFAEAWATFKVDENTDYTCDRVWQDEDVAVKSFTITPVDKGAPRPRSEIINQGRSVKIRGIAANIDYKISVEYETPADLTDVVAMPVIRLELHRPPPKPKTNQVRNNEENQQDGDDEN